MAQLIQGREAQRQQDPSLPTLELSEAYTQACRLHPDIAQAAEEAARKAEVAEKAAKAKKASNAAKRVAGGKSGEPVQKLTLKQEIQKNIRAQASA